MPNLQITCMLSQPICFCGYLYVVPVRCRLRAPEPETFIREGSSGFRKLWAIDTKFGTLMELNERNSMVHAIW